MRWIMITSLFVCCASFAQTPKLREPTLQDLMGIRLPDRWEAMIAAEIAPKKKGGLYEDNGPTEYSVRRHLIETNAEARKAAIEIWKVQRAAEKRKADEERAAIASKAAAAAAALKRTEAEEIRFNNIPILEPSTDDLMGIRLPAEQEREILGVRPYLGKSQSPPDGNPVSEAQDERRRWILDNDPAARAYAVQEWKKAERFRLLRIHREKEEKRKARYARVPPMYDESKSVESVVTNCGRESPPGQELKPFVFLRIAKDYQKNGGYRVTTKLYVYPDKQAWRDDTAAKNAQIYAAAVNQKVYVADQISAVAYGAKYRVQYERFAHDFIDLDLFGGSRRGTDAFGALTGDLSVVTNRIAEATIFDYARMSFDVEGYQKLQTYPAEKEVYDPILLEGEVHVGALETDPNDRTALKFTPHENQSFANLQLRCLTSWVIPRP